MKTKALVFFIFALLMFSVATLFTVLFNTAPSTISTIVLFYISVAVTLFSVIFLANYLINYWKFHLTPPWASTMAGLRWGSLTGIFVCLLLAMQAQRLLNIPTGVILVVIVVILELIWRRRLNANKMARFNKI